MEVWTLVAVAFGAVLTFTSQWVLGRQGKRDREHELTWNWHREHNQALIDKLLPSYQALLHTVEALLREANKAKQGSLNAAELTAACREAFDKADNDVYLVKLLDPSPEVSKCYENLYQTFWSVCAEFSSEDLMRANRQFSRTLPTPWTFLNEVPQQIQQLQDAERRSLDLLNRPPTSSDLASGPERQKLPS
jgi:hypothetical protein